MLFCFKVGIDFHTCARFVHMTKQMISNRSKYKIIIVIVQHKVLKIQKMYNRSTVKYSCDKIIQNKFVNWLLCILKHHTILHNKSQ